MFITSILGISTGLSISLILVKLNEILTHSGTRAPNGFDMLLIFSFPLLAIFGLIYGFRIGKKISALEPGLQIIFQTPYIYHLAGALILTLIAIFLWKTA